MDISKKKGCKRKERGELPEMDLEDDYEERKRIKRWSEKTSVSLDLSHSWRLG